MYKTLGRGILCLFLGLTLLGLPSCGAPATSYQPLDESESRMFSDSIREAIGLYDGSFFAQHQDNNRMVERIASQAGLSGEALEDAKEVMGFMSLADGILIGDPEQGGDWTYVEITRLRERDGKPVIQVRTHDKDFMFDYYEFLVEKRTYKDVQTLIISDYYSYNSGNWLSQSIADMSQYIHQSTNDSIVMQEEAMAAYQVSEDFQRGNFALGERGFLALPDSTREDQLLNQLRLEAAAAESDSTFKIVLADYRNRFPKDMSVFGLIVEQAYSQKDYLAIERAIRTYQAEVGGPDAYLWWMLGDVKVYQNQLDSAVYYLNQSIALEPDFIPPLISNFYAQLDLSDYAAAMKAFEQLEAKGYRLENMDLDAYPDFLNSSEMAAWAAISDPMPTGKQ